MNDDIHIQRYQASYRETVLDLSMAAWRPVFEAMEPEVLPYVFHAFYPHGWQERQLADIGQFVDSEPELIWVAIKGGTVVGWIGGRIHAEDQMGEIYILAVSPENQRQGIAQMLMEQLINHMRNQGLGMVMVETGDDAGHSASRAVYKSAGFERWPVARYFRKL